MQSIIIRDESAIIVSGKKDFKTKKNVLKTKENTCNQKYVYLSVLLLLSRFRLVRLCVTPQRAAHQGPPSRDSPGKNAGVGCHFLLQCMKVKSEIEVAQLCPTLRNPTDCSLPGSPIQGIFQARILEWVAIASSISICKIEQLLSCTHLKVEPESYEA